MNDNQRPRIASVSRRNMYYIADDLIMINLLRRFTNTLYQYAPVSYNQVLPEYENLLRHFGLAPSETPVKVPVLFEKICLKWTTGELTIADMNAIERCVRPDVV